MHDVADRICIGQRIAGRSQRIGHLVEVVDALVVGDKDGRWPIRGQVAVTGVLSDADDLKVVSRACGVSEGEIAADRVYAREAGFRKAFVYDGYRLRAGAVAIVHFTAGQNRNLHGGKESRSDHEVARVNRFAGYADVGTRISFTDQSAPGKRRAANSGNAAESPLQSFIEQGSFRFVASGQARVHPEEQQVLTIETDFDCLEVRKRSHEEPGREEHE